MRLRSHTKKILETEYDQRKEQPSNAAYESDQQIYLEDQNLDTEDMDGGEHMDEDEHKDGDEHENGDLTKDEIVKPLTLQKLAEFEKEQNKTGLVYLSRIPPFMKPAKIKHLLSKFGEVGRIYLAPEDPKIKARRVKYKRNRKQNYTEGWVEFMDKKVAKNVAAALNAQPIGGNKRDVYHDDLWNIKYLPKFKWNNLTEQIVYENRERTHRLQAEISKSRREIKDYIKKVEKSKMIRNIEQKKAKRMVVENETLS
ncbi:ESF2/ABP1 family protein [Gigaspora margarita]|uniref:18S rRNA factor 2 n=1 Tax=Gigaspora margarita TaxID=4874 RepID=A0A8H4A1X1_GIGMA|nr:ESF2/ABP1 family protein [Gigaspora margarita]